MRRSTLAICALLTVATYGCDSVKEKLKLAWDKVRGKSTPTATAPTPPRPATDTSAAGRGAAQQQAGRTTTPPPPPPRQSGGGGAPVRDMPYVSQDTGTIAPGMSEREVYSLWGAPAEVRRAGEYTYLFFPNGCERTCGTADVVTLQNGAVIDAIVRWDGHRYSGESSSPPGKMPIPNRGGDTLRVPPP